MTTGVRFVCVCVFKGLKQMDVSCSQSSSEDGRKRQHFSVAQRTEKAKVKQPLGTLTKRGPKRGKQKVKSSALGK